MAKIRNVLAVIVLFALLTSGCTSFNSFSSAVRAGDTLSLSMGWNPDLKRDQLTVTITPSSGAPVIYLPGDPAVRALANLYPDPMSRLIIERETGTFADDGFFYSTLMEVSVTGTDKDFSQKILIMDMPPGIAAGPATIAFSSTGGETLPSIAVEVLPGVGVSHQFQVQEGVQPFLGGIMNLAERAPHYVVSFSGSVVPHAIQLDLTHDPDQSLGGVGNPHVVSARGGDLKGAFWSGDGSNLKIILMPVNQAPTDIVNFKFYVAGGLQNLQLAPAGVSAYDVNGNDVLGVTATITPQ